MYNLTSFCRDLDLSEKLGYSSAVAFLGFGLILAIFRVFDIKKEASRVMVAAPLIAFVTTHILFLNFYNLDYGKFPFHVTISYNFGCNIYVIHQEFS